MNKLGLSPLLLMLAAGLGCPQRSISLWAHYSLEVQVDARHAGRRIDPRLFGTNLEPNAEVSPAVTGLCRELGITTYRFPGGGSPGWRFRTGVLDKAPEMNGCPLTRIETLRRFLGAVFGEAVMQVNLETGTPREAADLLRWMRDPAHPMRGVYFEIGNEPYGDWDAAYSSPAVYAGRVRQYAAALRAVDPTVKVGALLGGPAYDVDRSADGVDTALWDRRVLEGAGDVIDFVSVHWYTGVRLRENPLHVMGNSLRLARLVTRLRRLIARHAPGRRLEIGFLEWDGVFDQERGGMRHTLANAMFYAETLMQMARAGVTLSNQYELHTQSYGLFVGYDGCMKNTPGSEIRYRPFDGAHIRPKALALELLTRMAGGTLLQTRLDGGRSYSVTTHRPADEYAGEVPYWTAHAARLPERLALLLISRHPRSSALARIELQGFRPRGPAWARVLTGPSLTASNEVHRGTVQLREEAVEGLAVVLPPGSVTLVEIPGE